MTEKYISLEIGNASEIKNKIRLANSIIIQYSRKGDKT